MGTGQGRAPERTGAAWARAQRQSAV